MALFYHWLLILTSLVFMSEMMTMFWDRETNCTHHLPCVTIDYCLFFSIGFQCDYYNVLRLKKILYVTIDYCIILTSLVFNEDDDIVLRYVKSDIMLHDQIIDLNYIIGFFFFMEMITMFWDKVKSDIVAWP
jgi:hypothetical protein